MKKLIIIDSFGFFFRLYYAMMNLKSKDGKPSGMVFGFVKFINSLNEFKFDKIIFALDSKGKSFRNEIADNYKANRSAPPDDLKAQLPVCIDMISKMGFVGISYEGYEADDVIASIVKKYKNEYEIEIFTHDKDLYQLIDTNVKIYSPSKKALYDKDGCYEIFGVYPHQIKDYLSIIGDSADNVIGIKGIGPKGAKNLLDEFNSLDNIYENIDNIRNAKIKSALLSHKDDAFLSYKLVTLADDLEILSIDNAIMPDDPISKISDILRDYSINLTPKNSIKNQSKKDNKDNLKEDKQEYSLDFKPVLLTDEKELFEVLDSIPNDACVAFDTETTSLDTHIANIVGFSFCYNDEVAYYVPINHNYLGAPAQISMDCAKRAIEKIYSFVVIGHNLKYDFKVITHNFGLKYPKKFIDTMILSWLDDPAMPVGMDNLAKRLFGYDTIKFEDIVKKDENFGNIRLDIAVKYASEDAYITLKFYNHFKKHNKEIFDLAPFEFDFIKVLIELENSGIGIDSVALKSLKNSNDEKLATLRDEIFAISNESFNINSTKQLAEVLFQKLKLPHKKKTKTGYSTDESVLNGLKSEHIIIDKILQYREIYKLQSTYCEPFLKLSQKKDRIFTNFLQTGTATGRLSSRSPNLQNIPVSYELGKRLRECFISAKGYSFISLDYSQIELRLLAHFCKDEKLIEAFKRDEDIHSRTAIWLFGDDKGYNRNIAKSINFGLIYGMGATKLGTELGIPRNLAKEYIQNYFLAFPSVKEFLSNLKEESKVLGYSSTLFGRKRFFNFKTTNTRDLAMYEREAINSKFQGSAADIIKKAMIELSNFLSDNIRLILQIHDELIFEIRDDLIDEYGQKFKSIMEGVVNLNVPLKTSLSVGKNWGSLK